MNYLLGSTTEASATTHTSTMVDSTTSLASSTTTTPRANDTSGLSSGAIAGIVVGTIAFLCLLACGFYITYRIGRSRREGQEKPRRSLIDSLDVIPRLKVSMTWTRPKSNTQPPVLQALTEDNTNKPREMLGDTEQMNQRLPELPSPPVEL